MNRFPTFFRVLGTVRGPDCAPRWFRVQLPIKPNGVTGYVRAKAVETGPVRSRVVVDLSAKRLTLFRSGRRVFSTPVAVGSRATPTPTGRYYVNQRLIPQDPRGPYGPAAIGISAYSTVLTGLDAGRADRDPRDERALVDRPCRLERLHPRPQPGAAAPVRGHARGDAGRDPPVRRRVVVLALAVLCAGLAATLAATARQRVGADPEVDARPDGCGRDYLAQAQQTIPTWAYVGDRNAPATGPAPPQRRLEGLVLSRYERELAVHPTPRTCRRSTAATTST